MPAERVGWWQAILAVLAATLVTTIACVLVAGLLAALHLVPDSFGDVPGNGWPWRIDGVWALLADIGPMLAVGFLFAGVTCWYLTQRNGVHARRWPLALVAAAVGWVPLTGEGHGLLVTSGGAAFVVLVIAARAWSATERRPMPWSRALLAGILAASVALVAVSASYGTLHPLAMQYGGYPPAVKLRKGRSAAVDFALQNHGPAAARVLGLRLVDAGGLRLTGTQIGGAPGRYGALGFRARTLQPGEIVDVYLELSYPACRRSGTLASRALRAFDARVRVAGTERTQRVVLDDPLRVSCRGPGGAS
jgi:hypothetical protein